MLVGNWDKVYGIFTGQSANEDGFQLLVHWFQEQGTDSVGNVKVTAISWN